MISSCGTIVSLLLISAQSSLAQDYYYNQSGFGRAGPDTHDQEDLFIDAARNPTFTNNVSFPGFNFSLVPSSMSPQDLLLDANWTMYFNYSAVNVTSRTITPNETSLVSDITYDFEFPNGEPLPSQNHTDWTMCGHFLVTPFPSNLTSRFADETGNCSATLGAECLAAYRTAFLASRLNSIGNSSCPSPPFWKDIPECVTEIGQEFAMVSSSLMDWNPYSNEYNSSLSQEDYVGLNSSQPIFYQASSNYNNSDANVEAYKNEYAEGMRMAIFSFQPSRHFLESGFSGVVNRDVRFVCGTADPNTNSMQSAATSMLLSGREAWLLSITAVTATLLLF